MAPIVLTGVDDTEEPSPVWLIRIDEFAIDGEEGTLRIVEGSTRVYLDLEELPVSQARTLAAALIEVADRGC